MSFFDSLLNTVMSGFGGNSGVTGALAKELLSGFQQNSGAGLSDLVEQLSKKGLGNIVQSWVGTGPNQSVTPDQLSQAMDPGMLQQLAGKLGISPDVLTGHLADILPKIVDRLTPDGKLPDTAGALQSASA
jgi:uncharacterized protein YidB (DUF937 family)